MGEFIPYEELMKNRKIYQIENLDKKEN